MKKSYPEYTGKLVSRSPDGRETVIGFLSLWRYYPKRGEESVDDKEASSSS